MSERKRIKGNIYDILPGYKNNLIKYWHKKLEENPDDKEALEHLNSLIGNSRLNIFLRISEKRKN